MDELWRWLEALVVEREHGLVVFSSLGADGQVWMPDRPRQIPFYGAFAYPRSEMPASLKWDDQRPKVKACIQARIGRARDGVLLKTELLATPVAGQSYNKKAFTWLRKRIVEETSAGVRALNPETGGGHVYPSMRFTPGAVEFLKVPGHSWKTPDGDRIVYTPAS
jgi:hypothetical protein